MGSNNMTNNINYSMIPKLEEENINLYYQNCKENFKEVKRFFPLLVLAIPFTLNPKQIYIYGKLIPYDVLKKCHTEKDISRTSINILGTYPYDFMNKGIYVEDLDEKINWLDIPQDRRHRRTHPETGREILCTHHPEEEINDYKSQDRNIVILSSAWKLYMQYKKYKKTGEWTLKDLPHNHGTINFSKK